jgi:hypothetical protein
MHVKYRVFCESSESLCDKSRDNTDIVVTEDVLELELEWNHIALESLIIFSVDSTVFQRFAFLRIKVLS